MKARIIDALLQTNADCVLDVHEGKISVSMVEDEEAYIKCKGISDGSSDECTLYFETSNSDIELWVDLSHEQAEDVLYAMIDALILQGGSSEGEKEAQQLKRALLDKLREIKRPVGDDEC